MYVLYAACVAPLAAYVAAACLYVTCRATSALIVALIALALFGSGIAVFFPVCGALRLRQSLGFCAPRISCQILARAAALAPGGSVPNVRLV
jgi:hypothetical protein